MKLKSVGTLVYTQVKQSKIYLEQFQLTQDEFNQQLREISYREILKNLSGGVY